MHGGDRAPVVSIRARLHGVGIGAQRPHRPWLGVDVGRGHLRPQPPPCHQDQPDRTPAREAGRERRRKTERLPASGLAAVDGGKRHRAGHGARRRRGAAADLVGGRGGVRTGASLRWDILTVVLLCVRYKQSHHEVVHLLQQSNVN